MNHKKKFVSTSPTLNKGRAKKFKPKPKSPSPPHLNEIKERPPTRRNPNDFATVDKTRNVNEIDLRITTPPTKTDRRRSPSTKFKTIALGSQTPRKKQLADNEQHDYLQFSLRITEEIIKNDLYKNDDMVHILKKHYQANKSRLNNEKLLTAIGDLCKQLSIPLDDNLLLYMDNRGSYSRVCLKDVQSDYSMDQSMVKRCRSPKRTSMLLRGNPRYQSNKHSRQAAVGPDFPCVLNRIDSEDESSKQLSMNDHDFQPIMKQDQEQDTTTQNMNYTMNVIQPPTVMKNHSREFEFGEEMLNAPGEDSIQSLDMNDFQVIHDGTDRFVSDRDSETSIMTKHTQVGDSSDVSQTAIEQYGYQYASNLQLIRTGMQTGADLQSRDSQTHHLKKLVVSHYSTSVEPSTTETKEFCGQTNNYTEMETQSVPFYHDASTQKSMTADESSESESRIVIKFPPGTAIEEDFMDAIKVKCKYKCGTEEQAEVESAHGSNCLASTETQFVLLDCPVLIPKEHTKSMDILTKHSVHLDTAGKSVHKLMRMPQLPQSFLHQTVSAASQKPPDLQNNDYYDLTPQKDLFQPELPAAPMGRSSCSCIAGVDNNLLLTDRYERYRKVSENLAYFYPTIATQVSSMDLIPNDFKINLTLIDRDQERDRERDRNNDRDRKREMDRNKYVNGNRDRDRNWVRIVDRDRGREYNRNVEPEIFASYETLHEIKRPSMSTGSFYGQQSTPRKEQINLDNYRIESKHNAEYHPIGQKRLIDDDDAIADRDVDKDRIRQRDTEKDKEMEIGKSSPRKKHHDKDDVHDKGRPDSMARRIISIREDIEKYSNDDQSSKRNQISQVNSSIPDSSRRNDFLDKLKSNSSPLPTEVRLPRHKKMSVLRKAT